MVARNGEGLVQARRRRVDDQRHLGFLMFYFERSTASGLSAFVIVVLSGREALLHDFVDADKALDGFRVLEESVFAQTLGVHFLLARGDLGDGIGCESVVGRKRYQGFEFGAVAISVFWCTELVFLKMAEVDMGCSSFYLSRGRSCCCCGDVARVLVVVWVILDYMDLFLMIGSRDKRMVGQRHAELPARLEWALGQRAVLL